MKKTYLSPKVKTVVLGTCSLMTGSITGGDLGSVGEYGQAKGQLWFSDEEIFE